MSHAYYPDAVFHKPKQQKIVIKRQAFEVDSSNEPNLIDGEAAGAGEKGLDKTTIYEVVVMILILELMTILSFSASIYWMVILLWLIVDLSTKIGTCLALTSDFMGLIVDGIRCFRITYPQRPTKVANN